MSKRHILKDVNAKSMLGQEIIVEQIFEAQNFTSQFPAEWNPLPKIVIKDQVIPLNIDNSFIHPITEQIYIIN